MLEDTAYVEVRNISNSTAGYLVPELGVTRRFTPGEIKKISVGELRALSYIPGGSIMMKDFLSVNSLELLEEFGIDPVPEYFWTDEDVDNLLLNGSEESLLDAFDFAPQGIREKIRERAIVLAINDLKKRDIISQATGVNISTAIAYNELDKEERAKVEEPEKPKRRVAVSTKND